VRGPHLSGYFPDCLQLYKRILRVSAATCGQSGSTPFDRLP
jgi:hypothetical protein